MSIVLQDATATDEAAVIALWQECGLTRPWNDPSVDFRRALAYEGACVLIATQNDGGIVGTAMCGFDGHRGWVYYLGVSLAFRKQGIARLLLNGCTEWLGQRGCPKVELMVRDGNPDAHVYERIGWELQPVRVYARWIEKEGE